ncbi:MAG TPA: hypothetical protein PK685_03290 [archaeon]|nr:hypothetical protein [archaeon]
MLKNKFIYWIPRILSILFILFLAMFSLDVITPEASFLEIVGGLLIHNIPVFILTAILIISWKYEIVGAIAFILGGLLYLLNVLITIIRTPPFEWFYLSWILFISGPAFLIGILFLIGWLKKKSK